MIRILVDVDDVLINLLSAWLDYLNNKYNLCVVPDDITCWDIHKFYPSLTVEQVREPLICDDFWKTVKPKQDAVKYLRKLFNDGYEIFLCTSTDYRNIYVKHEHIIKKYFPYIDWEHVIITNNKQMIKADYLIDDGIHNLENGDYIKILMSSPANKYYDEKATGMIRVYNWKEIYNYVHINSPL